MDLRLLVPVALTGLLSSPSLAATIRVDLEGSGDYLTIQEGILASSDGDTVLVAPGTYTGSQNRALEFFGRETVLLSEAGAESTVVDCEHQDIGVYVSGDWESGVVIRGFAFTNAHSGWYGGAVLCDAFASPAIVNCLFRNNTAAYGAGIACIVASSPEIVDCAFTGNYAESDGGALACSGASHPSITGCTFTSNTAGSSGGAIHCDDHSTPAIANCTLATNAATTGGGMSCYRSDPQVANTIIAFSAAGEGVSCQLSDPGFTHCLIFGNADGDSLCGQSRSNLFEDPLFCDILAGDPTLCSNSPCLPSGNPWGESIGAHAQGCGECDSPTEGASWGVIKTLFR